MRRLEKNAKDTILAEQGMERVGYSGQRGGSVLAGWGVVWAQKAGAPPLRIGQEAKPWFTTQRLAIRADCV